MQGRLRFTRRRFTLAVPEGGGAIAQPVMMRPKHSHRTSAVLVFAIAAAIFFDWHWRDAEDETPTPLTESLVTPVEDDSRMRYRPGDSSLASFLRNGDVIAPQRGDTENRFGVSRSDVYTDPPNTRGSPPPHSGSGNQRPRMDTTQAGQPRQGRGKSSRSLSSLLDPAPASPSLDLGRGEGGSQGRARDGAETSQGRATRGEGDAMDVSGRSRTGAASARADPVWSCSVASALVSAWSHQDAQKIVREALSLPGARIQGCNHVLRSILSGVGDLEGLLDIEYELFTSEVEFVLFRSEILVLLGRDRAAAEQYDQARELCTDASWQDLVACAGLEAAIDAANAHASVMRGNGDAALTLTERALGAGREHSTRTLRSAALWRIVAVWLENAGAAIATADLSERQLERLAFECASDESCVQPSSMSEWAITLAIATRRVGRGAASCGWWRRLEQLLPGNPRPSALIEIAKDRLPSQLYACRAVR